MTTYKPDDCPALMPHLIVRDVKQALDWYEQAFGMTCRLQIPQENPVHAEMVWEDMVIMIGKASGTNPGQSQAPITTGVACPVSLYLYCSDVDTLFARAREHGAKSQMDIEDMFWGDRMCTLKDPEGHVWSFATKVGEFDPSKMPTPDQANEAAAPPPPREHHEVFVATMPDLRVFYDRHIGPYDASTIGPFFYQFMAKVAQFGICGPQSMVLGICQDDPRDTPEEDCRYDAGVTVNGDQPCPNGLMEQVLPGGDYVRILHKGPYDKLGETWQWIGETVFPNLGRECRPQPPFERYVNSPADTAPDDLLTEIYIPLD